MTCGKQRARAVARTMSGLVERDCKFRTSESVRCRVPHRGVGAPCIIGNRPIGGLFHISRRFRQSALSQSATPTAGHLKCLADE
jgi:hypothetical protein